MVIQLSFKFMVGGFGNIALMTRRYQGSEAMLPIHARRIWFEWLLVVAAIIVFCDCGRAASAQGERVYSNKEAGCTVSYPTNWLASTTYQNAVEIRNQNASPRDTASVLISWEQPVSTKQATHRVNDIIDAAARGTDFQLETITTDGGVLHFWTVLEPPAVPAKEKRSEESRKLLRVGSAIIGNWVVRAEGTVWQDADPQVIAEMRGICRNLKLIENKEKE